MQRCMTGREVAPQIEFKNLDDFIKDQNNYYAHFLDDCEFNQKIHRIMPHFKRFQEAHPEMEREVTYAAVRAYRSESRQRLPHEQLLETYKLMSKLVFVDDKYVMRDGQPDDWFLCR